jgi:hypothetical protein
VCQVSVGVLGDIARALEDQLQPFCDSIMQILLHNLQVGVPGFQARQPEAAARHLAQEPMHH